MTAMQTFFQALIREFPSRLFRYSTATVLTFLLFMFTLPVETHI